MDDVTEIHNLLKILKKYIGKKDIIYDDINQVYNINYKI
jgi:hypothetical protein